MVEQKTPKVTDFFVQTVFNKQKQKPKRVKGNLSKGFMVCEK